MKYATIPSLFRRADEYELHLCQTAINWSETRKLVSFFTVVSRLGDGVFWYTLLMIMLVFDSAATGLWLALTGLTSTLVYKSLKGIMARERPFITHPSVLCAAKTLDRFSFPSGHTLHAVCFSTVLFATHPYLALGILPFTIAVAMSRVVLGLHYPSDVAAGALIGFVIACLSIAFYLH